MHIESIIQKLLRYTALAQKEGAEPMLKRCVWDLQILAIDRLICDIKYASMDRGNDYICKGLTADQGNASRQAVIPAIGNLVRVLNIMRCKQDVVHTAVHRVESIAEIYTGLGLFQRWNDSIEGSWATVEQTAAAMEVEVWDLLRRPAPRHVIEALPPF